MDCLKDIIGIRDFCEPQGTGLYLSDFVDVSTIMLAHLANDEELTGREYAQKIINGAIAQVEADLALSTSDGVQVRDVVYTLSINQMFSTAYTSGQGAQIVNFFRSSYSKIYVNCITFKGAFDGDFVIILDDGTTKTEITATSIAGQEVTIPLDYSTLQKQVRIYAKDTSLQFAILSGQSSCGSCAAKSGKYLGYQGFNGTNATSTAVGFKPCAYVGCDMSNIVCQAVNRNKTLLAKAVALKAGEMAYMRLLISPRMNDTTINISEENAKLYLNTLVAKYRETMFGSAQAYGNASTAGIIQVMKRTFQAMNDQCLVCSGQMFSSTAIF